VHYRKRVVFLGDDANSWLRPLGLLAWSMKLTDGADYSSAERARLSDAAHEWDVCFEDNSDLLAPVFGHVDQVGVDPVEFSLMNAVEAPNLLVGGGNDPNRPFV